MSAEARSVVVRLSAETAQYIREMQKAGLVGAESMSKVEKSTMTAGQALDKTGQAGGRIAVGLTGVLVGAGKAAVDWETAWAGVTKTVDGSATQMDRLEGGLRNMAKTLPATHTEIAAVAEAAGQLGVNRGAILDFTKTMVDLGETTNLTADQAATSIAQIQNVMGTAPKDVDNFGAALVALGNAGASTESQILDMTQRIAGAGAQIGLAETDILAIANAAASMGINAEAGGSAISTAFTKIAIATKQGGDKLESFAATAGMSGQEFVKAFETDPARAFASFTKGLDGVKTSGGDVFSLLKELGLSDVRVSQALLGMASSGDMLTDSLDLGAKAWEKNTALAEEAEKRYDTTASKTQVSWNKIKDSGIEAGDVLLPAIAEIAEGAGDIATAFGDLPEGVQSGVVKTVAALAGAGGLVWATSKVVSGVNTMRDVWGGFASMTSRGGGNPAAPITAMGDAAAGTSRKMLAMRGAGALAGGALMAIGTQAGESNKALGALATVGGGALTGFALAGPIGGAIGAGAGLLTTLATSADDSAESMEAAAAATQGYSDTLDGLGGAITEATRKMAFQRAEESGLMDTGLELGLSQRQVVDALVGQGSARKDLIKTVQGHIDAIDEEAAAIRDRYQPGKSGRGASAAIEMQAVEVEKRKENYQAILKEIGVVDDAVKGKRQEIDAITDWGARLKGVPKRVVTEIETEGVPRSAKQVADFARHLNLTPREVRTLVKALNTEGARINLNKVKEVAEDLGRQRPTVKASADTREAETKAARLEEKLDRLHAMRPSPKVDAQIAAAEAALSKVNAHLESLDGKTSNLYITTTLRTVTEGRSGPQSASESALGNLFPSVRTFAKGDIANNHQPEIAPGGAWRIWAEDETGGEAYIPLANDHRRPRAKSILEETASRLGAKSVEWFANGKGDDKVKERAEKERERREEERRKAEEKRQSQLEEKRKRDLLASNLRNEQEQQRLELADAKRRLKSAKEAGRPKSEIRDAQLAVKQEKAEQAEARDQRAREAEDERTRIAEESARAEEEARDEAERRQKEHDDAVLAGQERAWDKLTGAAEKHVEDSKKMVEDVKSKMDSIGAAATAAFKSDWFAKSGQDQRHGLWVGANTTAAGDWRSMAESDNAGLRERQGLITQLSDPSLGLSGKALEDLLGKQSNAGISAMLAAGEVDDYAALFAQREELLGSVSAQAGMAGYGQEYAAASSQLVLTNQKLDQLNAAVAAARPINLTSTISDAEMIAEMARLQGNY